MYSRILISNFAIGAFCCLLTANPFTCSRHDFPHDQGGDPNTSIADKHPHDAGIENDPDVLYAEKFQGKLSEVVARYQDVLNIEGMSLDADLPAGITGTHSLKITNTGGQNTGGHLFKSFDPGFDSTVYLRYYVKYPLSSKGYIHHESVWIGGYSPNLTYPYPRAGTCGIDGRLSIAYEPISDSLMGTYNYWTDMKSWNGGSSCYGNLMMPDNNTNNHLNFDKWTCIELKIKLNSSPSVSNGALAVWQDGVQVGNWEKGSPNGMWTKDVWRPDTAGAPFEGFRWRADPALNINNIWIEFYDDATPEGISHHINYSNIVLAKKYVGPVRK